MINFIKSLIDIKVVSAATVQGRLNSVAGANYDINTVQTPMTILGTLISIGLGLLGVIFVVLVIVAGYKWMMAGGDSKKIDESKDSLWRAVIGLIITVSAYAIKAYVFAQL